MICVITRAEIRLVSCVCDTFAYIRTPSKLSGHLIFSMTVSN